MKQGLSPSHLSKVKIVDAQNNHGSSGTIEAQILVRPVAVAGTMIEKKTGPDQREARDLGQAVIIVKNSTQALLPAGKERAGTILGTEDVGTIRIMEDFRKSSRKLRWKAQKMKPLSGELATVGLCHGGVEGQVLNHQQIGLNRDRRIRHLDHLLILLQPGSTSRVS